MCSIIKSYINLGQSILIQWGSRVIQIHFNYYLQFGMSIKIFLLAALVVLASSYTLEGNVLVLKDDDFPGVLSEFSHILIEFYAPWCGHCKKLAPIYTEVADELKAQGSAVRLAKVDSTEEKKCSSEYGVKGYPTLLFFLNGKKMDYNGQRSKTAMVNWLLKRTRDPVSQITAEQYAQLEKAKGVSVVYHGDFTKEGSASILSDVAAADDYNTYYWGTDLGKPEGSVELIRDFDTPVTYETLDEGLKNWLTKNQRPAVVPFDERTIGDVFSSKKIAIILFNAEDSKDLLAAFTDAAKQYSETDGKPFVFTEISAKNEHLDNFAKYIKTDKKAHPIVIVEAGSQTKYVLGEEATKQNILSFLSNHSSSKYGLTDEVKVVEKKKEQTKEPATEEEL